MESTLPTTTFLISASSRSVVSTLEPDMVMAASKAWSSAVDVDELVQPFSRKIHNSYPPLLELRQEAQVVVVNQPQVGDTEAAHGQSLQADAEGKAGVDLGVDAAALAARWGCTMPAAQQLNPAFALAGAAAGAVALEALDVDLGSWAR